MARRQRRPAPAKEKLGVGYTRYSTEDQSSTAEQVAINEDLALEQGVRIVRTFNDESMSRSISDRPGLVALIAYLQENPEVRWLVVNELERLTAGTEQRAEIARLCRKLDVWILTEDLGPLDPHDDDKMQEADARAVASKGEVLKIRRRVRRNLRAKVVTGSTVALRPPFGLRMKPLVTADGVELASGVPMFDAKGREVTSGELERHPTEFEWLVKIFDWAAEGVTSDKIARRLADAGVPTKTGKSTWRGNSVNGILDNPLYKGEMTWGKQQVRRDENGKKFLVERDPSDPGRVTFPSPLGPVIDPEKWEAIHKLRQERLNTRNMTRRTYPPQVFDNLVWCGRCGHKMYGRVDNPGRCKTIRWRYFCLSVRPGYEMRDGRPLCKSTQSMSLAKMLEAMANLGGGQGVATLAGVSNRNAVDAERRKLETEVKAADEEYETALRLTIKGLMSEAQLEAQKAERDQRVAAAESRLTELAESKESPRELDVTPELSEVYREMAETLADENYPLERKLTLLRDVGLERVWVDSPGVTFEIRS